MEGAVEFPKIINTPKGVRVQMSKGSFLPGIFINEHHATRAIEKANNKPRVKYHSRKQ